MSPQTIFIFGALLTFFTILSISNACPPWDKCSDDFLGSSTLAIQRKLKRVYLEPFAYQKIITVPVMCYSTQGVLAHACAQDVAPLVKVNSLNEVYVRRIGASANRILVDITVYCNSMGQDRTAPNDAP